jgi:Holliday junction DNA helicase RuvB
MTQVVTPARGGTSDNELRPTRLRDVIGQERTKRLLARAIDSCFERRRPLEHTLLLGPSGTGKTTLAMTLAAELNVDVYHLSAPISFDTLLSLRTQMYDGDILFIDEIHQQAIAERRGKSAATQPEVLYSVMEDRTIVTSSGVLPFPRVTIIGATTDPGMLPEPFINRFALRPTLERYTHADLARIVRANANVLDVGLTDDGVTAFVTACRGVPRECNNLVRTASVLFSPGTTIAKREAREVLAMIGVTEDGLTPQMQGMLKFLRERAGRRSGDGTIAYQASVGTIATAIGLSRDAKAVALHVEPYLIERGFVQVGHGGRVLTDRGVHRAEDLA